MRLERASSKAIRYAILNWHYSRSLPSVMVAYAVFNGAGDWCGVICFSAGANNRIGSPYGLPQGRVAELVRVALNGKQESTSKALSLAIRLFRKDCPLCELLVSYADPQRQHVGTLYQATNWVYVGETLPQAERINPKTGKVLHKRTAVSVYGTASGLKISQKFYKLKYLYPLTERLRKRIEPLRKPYPKKESKSDAAVV